MSEALKEACLDCKGTGRIFHRVDDSHRFEAECPTCAGSGSFALALAAKMTGENPMAWKDMESEAAIKWSRIKSHW